MSVCSSNHIFKDYFSKFSPRQCKTKLLISKSLHVIYIKSRNRHLNFHSILCIYLPFLPTFDGLLGRKHVIGLILNKMSGCARPNRMWFLQTSEVFKVVIILVPNSFSVKTRDTTGFHRPDDNNTNLEYLIMKGDKRAVVVSFNSSSRKWRKSNSQLSLGSTDVCN